MLPETTDNAHCPLCSGANLVTKYVLPNPTYKTVQCKACGFAFMNPYPSDAFLDAHYAASNLYGFDGEHAEYYDRAVIDRRDLIESLLNRYAGKRKRGRAVDFGAGIGIAVAALNGLGFEAIGLDKNPRASAVGRRLFDVDIIDCEIGEVRDGIDLLTMFDVLEHIKYPARFLAGIRASLAEGACFIGVVPNYYALGRYLHGAHSATISFPQHVSYFSRRTLEHTLDAGGFDTLYIGFPAPYGVSLTFGWRKSLLRRFGRNAPVRHLVPAITFAKRHIAYPLLNLFVEKTGLLGHSLVFIARSR